MKAPAQAPVRSCVGCSSRDAQSALLRLRLTGGALVVAKRGSGRSAYVHPRRDCVSGLLRSKGLGRSLRAKIDVEARRGLIVALEERLAVSRFEETRS